MSEYYDNAIDVPVDKVIGILRSAEMRITRDEYGTDWPELFYNEGWRRVVRTDYCDDVCTGLCATKTVEEWRQHYLKKAAHARLVRIGPARFAIIDAMTDG